MQKVLKKNVDKYLTYNGVNINLFDLLRLVNKNRSKESDDNNLIYYLLEYNFINGIKYLINKHYFHFDNYLNDYSIDYKSLRYDHRMKIEIARFIISLDDPTMFQCFFKPSFFFFDNYYISKEHLDSIYVNKEILKAILNSDKIFDSLLKEDKRIFKAIPINNKVHIINKEDYKDVYIINPLVNILLDYSLSNLDKYKNKAIKILEYAKTYNKKVRDNLNPKFKYKLGNNGTLRVEPFTFYSNLIYTDIRNVKDKEISKMLDDL